MITLMINKYSLLVIKGFFHQFVLSYFPGMPPDLTERTADGRNGLLHILHNLVENGMSEMKQIRLKRDTESNIRDAIEKQLYMLLACIEGITREIDREIEEMDVNSDYKLCYFLGRFERCYSAVRPYVKLYSYNWKTLFLSELEVSIKTYVCEENNVRIQKERFSQLSNVTDCSSDAFGNLPACQAVHLDGIGSHSDIYTLLDEFFLCYEHLPCPNKSTMAEIVVQAAKRCIELLP